MKIGAQFYTLRDFCKNLDDFAETLKKVADIGYKTVQISSTCDFEAEWLKNQLKINGLSCVITHTQPDKLLSDIKRVAKEHTVFGCNNIGLSFYPFGNEEKELKEIYDTFVKTYKPVAQVLKNEGKYFMYHNHAAEFRKLDGKTVFKRLSEDFSPDELGFILDTYWIQVGGGDPSFWLENLKGRVPCIHLKDCAYGQKMAVIGEGNINFDRVFEKAEYAGTEYMLVEQDDCYGEDPFECLKRSYNYLKSRGFE